MKEISIRDRLVERGKILFHAPRQPISFTREPQADALVDRTEGPGRAARRFKHLLAWKTIYSKSREGVNSPITRQQALNVLKVAAKAVGVKENVGTHTLRKTWGYHAWKNGFSPALIMETLNHSNLSITKRYLGIRQNEINDLYDSLNL